MILEELNALFAATALFVVAHFLLSSQPQRGWLVHHVGARAFRLGYSVIMALAFAWMLLAYEDSPYVPLWDRDPLFGWLAVAVMPLACLLFVCSLTTPNPTAVGGERLLRDSASESLTHGIMTVTRHPMLWAFALWAAVHLLATGDTASVILCCGILVLSLGGMWHIDRRRGGELGSDWGPYVMTTSAIPFVAVIQRRTSIDWHGIGWGRTALALALYVALLWVHPFLFGARAIP